MPKYFNPLMYICSFLALILCWYENLHYTGNWGQFIPDLFVTHASASFTYDIVLLGLALFIWMFFDSRKNGVKYYWIYVVLSIAIGISVMVPIYLAQRNKAQKNT